MRLEILHDFFMMNFQISLPLPLKFLEKEMYPCVEILVLCQFPWYKKLMYIYFKIFVIQLS